MLNKNQSQKRNSLKYAVVIPALVAFVFLFQIKVEARAKFSESKRVDIAHEATSNESPDYDNGFIFDKISADKEFTETADILKKEYNIDLKWSNLKRNSKGEIIAVKMTFTDRNGKKGSVEQDRKIPIRPIFFRTKASDDGKYAVGFYDNHEMISKPKDNITESKIVTVESITDEMLIFVDGQPYTKEDLDYLDPKGLEKIEILTGQKAIARFGNKAKNGAAIVTTNWTKIAPAPAAPPVPPATVSPAAQERKIIIFQNDNGDDIVFIPAENSLKIPSYPSIHLKNNPPVLIVNGVEKSNPFETLEKMDLKKVKSVRGFDENGKETPGTAIKKLIITTK